MGTSKTDLFSKEENELALLFKSLAHPARVAIIDYLLKTNSCVCSDIVEELPLAQPTISQHLKELKASGLIKGNIEGNSICYCINIETIEKFENYFSKIKTEINNKCC